MEQNNKYIEDLLEKFFEGLTSVSEEKELYRFFAETEILPEHLNKYKSMFEYLGTEIEIELEEIFKQESKVIAGEKINLQNNTLLDKKWMITISAIAASLLLIFLINPFGKTEDFNTFEGSFVKIDGVVIEDEAAMEAEYLRLRALVKQKMADLDKPLADARQQMQSYEKTNKMAKKRTKKRTQ